MPWNICSFDVNIVEYVGHFTFIVAEVQKFETSPDRFKSCLHDLVLLLINLIYNFPWVGQRVAE
jgi:hypothetical protein